MKRALLIGLLALALGGPARAAESGTNVCAVKSPDGTATRYEVEGEGGLGQHCGVLLDDGKRLDGYWGELPVESHICMVKHADGAVRPHSLAESGVPGGVCRVIDGDATLPGSWGYFVAGRAESLELRHYFRVKRRY